MADHRIQIKDSMYPEPYPVLKHNSNWPVKRGPKWEMSDWIWFRARSRELRQKLFGGRDGT